MIKISQKWSQWTRGRLSMLLGNILVFAIFGDNIITMGKLCQESFPV